jgi:hypothetical protein
VTLVALRQNQVSIGPDFLSIIRHVPFRIVHLRKEAIIAFDIEKLEDGS